MSQARIAQIINNTNFGEIYNLLSHGRDMDYIAEHYHLDLPLAWALRLKGDRKICSPSKSCDSSWDSQNK